MGSTPALRPEAAVDFNRDVRPILSGKCFLCHGPDDSARKGRDGGLRLDLREGATREIRGKHAIVPGKPGESELLRRARAEDARRMPPPDTGKELSPAEISTLEAWIRQGARYEAHWSYRRPVRPAMPAVRRREWPRGAIDTFLLARLEAEGLEPSAEADPAAIVRRAALDLAGLPPSLETVDAFLSDPAPDAHDRLLDALLASPAYGEHWARLWLDLARYADSAGYADDPQRTIWAYRDYVIGAFNENKPFDAFTLEQLAGDLLMARAQQSGPERGPEPARESGRPARPLSRQETLIATAFHRNTMTNSEGGTNDEEFRNVAIVDRVNTTMEVWMGTTIGCAQCHNHKYDPITQEEFFRLFAIFNNTADADRPDESPLLPVWSEEQEATKARLATEIAQLEARTTTLTPALGEASLQWSAKLRAGFEWGPLWPADASVAPGVQADLLEDGSLLVEAPGKTDVYVLLLSPERPSSAVAARGGEGGGGEGGGGEGGEGGESGGKGALPHGEAFDTRPITALRLEALPDSRLPGGGPGHAGGDFALTGVHVEAIAPASSRVVARRLRIEVPGKGKILSLAEVEVWSAEGAEGPSNVAREGKATQKGVAYNGRPELAIDGNTSGDYNAGSTTHTETTDDPWWELDLGRPVPIERIVLWNRTDNGLQTRLKDFKVTLLDEASAAVFVREVAEPPNPSVELPLGGPRPVPLAVAFADFAAEGHAVEGILLGGADGASRGAKAPAASAGWSIRPRLGEAHQLTLILSTPLEVEPGMLLRVAIEQRSAEDGSTLGRLRLCAARDPEASVYARTPAGILALLARDPATLTDGQREEVARHYLTLAPSLAPSRQRLAAARSELEAIRPLTTVPIFEQLPEGRRRETRIQRRGNFLEVGDAVTEGVPAVFPPIEGSGPPDRLALARWLVSQENPLTPRVVSNRLWEAIFGIGIVRTSEEFGAQGDLPSHPELLDWLAAELIDNGWNLKRLIRQIAGSAAYRQTSRVEDALVEKDPDNRLLARGPRSRLPAEVIRDQALAVSGLLSRAMFGPPVRPPQPSTGLSAAFGSRIDWETSQGGDRYRRGLYTQWRRSNPYPSMAAFDAPSREVCTLRRVPTNTPLQALVTLNDPVFVECALALAKVIVAHGGSVEAEATYAFQRCLSRPPSDAELAALVRLQGEARARYEEAPGDAARLTGQAEGAAPGGGDGANVAGAANVAGVADLAAWTVVGNVLLNLDELLMKR